MLQILWTWQTERPIILGKVGREQHKLDGVALLITYPPLNSSIPLFERQEERKERKKLHLTYDTRHVTRDSWHVTCDIVNLLSAVRLSLPKMKRTWTTTIRDLYIPPFNMSYAQQCDPNQQVLPASAGQRPPAGGRHQLVVGHGQQTSRKSRLVQR